MKDYTLAQGSPIAESPRLPSGKDAIDLNQLGQLFYKEHYGNRPKWIHTISSTLKKNYWLFNVKRQRLISNTNFAKDKLVCIEHDPRTKEVIRFAGWLYFEDVTSRWDSATVPDAMELHNSNLYPMSTFNTIDENYVDET